MTSLATEPPPAESPAWRHCGHGADPAADPVGCRGARVSGGPFCLAHQNDADRTAYLATLGPGAYLDHRGTSFTANLLTSLLAAVIDSATGRPHIRDARFDGATFGNKACFNGTKFGINACFKGATFGDDAWFNAVTFDRGALFDWATFGNNACFNGATFGPKARFAGATFGDYSQFERATFGDNAEFAGATFGNRAWFAGATFGNNARFEGVTFGDNAQFDGSVIPGDNSELVTFGDNADFARATFGNNADFNETTFGDNTQFQRATFGSGDLLAGSAFSNNASFERAVFERVAVVGPLACSGTLDLSGAAFGTAVTIEVAAAAVWCRRTRWASTAALRLRHATVDLSSAVVEYPVSVAAHTRPFRDSDGLEVPAPGLTDSRVRVVSLRGADAAHLVLTDVDLTECRFAGTIHLDQLRLEGRCPLPTAPSEQRRWRLTRRWTPRRTLAEEQHWRADRPSGTEGWTPAPEGEKVLEPAALAPTYRQLRKAFEDGKNEPGAADFYYGECEMRRHDEDTPGAERALLTVYWAVSGYGLRASRAIGWLLMALAATVTVMMLWGLPQETPKPTTTGRQVEAGHSLTLVTDTPDPVNPRGPLADRLTSERFSKALHVTLESGLFRSSGQNLTTIGTGAELVFRFIAPFLLALAVLSVRGRVKR